MGRETADSKGIILDFVLEDYVVEPEPQDGEDKSEATPVELFKGSVVLRGNALADRNYENGVRSAWDSGEVSFTIEVHNRGLGVLHDLAVKLAPPKEPDARATSLAQEGIVLFEERLLPGKSTSKALPLKFGQPDPGGAIAKVLKARLLLAARVDGTTRLLLDEDVHFTAEQYL